ncbi:MAG: DUF4349 domain-containing protein [Actinomycetes bacterium]
MRKRIGMCALALSGLVVGVSVSACSGGARGSSAGTVASAPGATLNAPEAVVPGASRGSVGTTGTAHTAGIATTVLTGHDLVLTATVSVRAADVAAATRRTEQLVAAAHGFLADEQLNTDPAHPNADTATLTVRVPQASYDATISTLERLGTRVSEQRSSEDVTDQVVDTSSRLSTAKASIGRVRTLLDRANSLGQVIQLESELSKREADIESLERRIATLRKQVALATIDVTFSRTAKSVAATRHQESGFVGGIVSGWHAFTRTVSALLRAVGAVLPFAVAVGLLALAVVLLRRRLRLRPATIGDDVHD